MSYLELNIKKSPYRICEKYSEVEHASEMSHFQRDYLYSIIEKKRPKTILEIGVAAGGTTALILDWCRSLAIHSKVYSCDISERMWSDCNKRTGYILEEIKADEPDLFSDFKLFLGHTVTTLLRDMSSEIDLCILDTVHFLPGEILDFLAVLPYMADDGVVVLHDVYLSQLQGNKETYATKILLSTIKTKKYIMDDPTEFANANNIAAFEISEELRANIIDVFYALGMVWSYYPGEDVLDDYKAIYEKNYNKECLDLFEQVLRLQRRIEPIRMVYDHAGSRVVGKWEKVGVLLYGCGTWGRRYYNYAKLGGLDVIGMVVTSLDNISESDRDFFKVPIYELDSVPPQYRETRVIIAADEPYRSEMINLAVQHNFTLLI